MGDLKARLRDEPDWEKIRRFGLNEAECKVWDATCREGADEIERLTAEKDKLRQFLENGGIDSAAVLASGEYQEWYDENERLTARNELLEKVLDEMSQFRRLRGISPETLAVLDSIVTPDDNSFTLSDENVGVMLGKPQG